MRSELKKRLLRFALLAGVALLYFAAGEVSMCLTYRSAIASPIWPCAGIALGLVLVVGYCVWPGVLCGAIALGLAAWPIHHRDVWAGLAGCLCAAVGNTLQALAGGWLVNRFARGREFLAQPHTVLLFVLLGAIVSPVIGATSGAATRVLAGFSSWQQASDLWLVYWLGAMASVILTTPLMVVWSCYPFPILGGKRAVEAGAVVLLLLLFCGLSFGGWFAGQTWGVSFLIIPLNLWIALRFDPRGTATAAFIAGGLATIGTLSGRGAFVLPNPTASLLLLQNFVVVIMVMSLVLAADVTQRERMDHGLRASARELRHRVEELQAVFDAAPVGIAVAHDPECRSVTSNPACASVLPANGAAMPATTASKGGQSPVRILREGREVPPAEWPMQYAARAGVAVPGQELEIVLPDGRVLNSYVSASPLYDDARKVRGSLGIFVDLTAKKQAEREILRLNAELERRVSERTAQLEAINKELEAFSYSVSHDLRAPLRSIRGFSEVVLERYASKIDSRGQDILQRICSASQQMDDLIEDLLKLSRVSRSELVCKPVDLSKLAEAIAAGLCQAEPKRSVKFILKPGLVAQGDERLLRIVLENLFRNAWKFTLQQTKPRIEFGFVSEPTPAFFVRDNGAGFDMAYADRLFRVFQRLHSATEFPGTGVGLATVQRIINRHGGRIWAEGVVNQGATFNFSLPVSEEAGKDYS
jgi:signal transduction histidine kinase